MLNELANFIRTYSMISPGDRVICAVSGGRDSMALLWGLYLLKDKWNFTLSAAHFNHHLRGEESDRDEQFVREFCGRYEIRLYIGSAQVVKGEKGLEAAAREARYAFFRTLPGKIATAHTANDNAETVLLHLVRGTGLKGLGAIAPVGENLIRPMLSITRSQLESFLEEYHIPYIDDSSNGSDQFLRNRIRHNVMPLLAEENPRLWENLSRMALCLRQDEALLESLTQECKTPDVERLRQMPEPLRRRILDAFLKENGVKEPNRSHILLAEALVFSDKPSARASFSGGIAVERCYNTLRVRKSAQTLRPTEIACPGEIRLPRLGLRLICREAREIVNTENTFTVAAEGTVHLRSRLSGDEIRLSGGTKSLKKLFVDRKIPASQRPMIPVIADDSGVLGVYGIGAHRDRIPEKLPAVQFIFEKIDYDTLGGF